MKTISTMTRTFGRVSPAISLMSGLLLKVATLTLVITVMKSLEPRPMGTQQL